MLIFWTLAHFLAAAPAVFAQEQMEDYRKLMEGIDLSDPSQVDAVMAPIRAHLHALDIEGANDRNTAVVLMSHAKKTFGTLVCLLAYGKRHNTHPHFITASSLPLRKCY